MRNPSVKNCRAEGDKQPAGESPPLCASSDSAKKRAENGSAIVAQLPDLKTGSLMQSAASLIWLPQAGLLAYSVQQLAGSGRFRNIILPAITFLMLGILRACLDMQANRRIFKASRAAVTRLRNFACTTLASRSPLDTQRPPSGQAASILAEQTEAVLPFLQRFQPVQYKLAVIPLSILICIGWFSWLAALILLIAAPLIPFSMAVIGYRAKKASEAQLVEVGSMNAFLLDRLRGLASIRSLDAVDVTANRFRASAESLKKRTMAVLRIAFLSSAVLELFSMLGIAMVAVYIGFHLLGQLSYGTWGEKLVLGEGLFILLLCPAFFEPLQELSAAWHDRAAGKAAIAALDRLSEQPLPLPGALRFIETQPPSTLSPPQIILSGLAFQHRGAHRLIFKDYSLSINPGEKVALLGPSGSGKSTLLAMLAGLIPTTAGEIRIGNMVLDDASAATIRQRMAWVGQKPHIFSGTLRSNITIGRGDISRSQIDNAMVSAALGEVARNHPGPVGEGGSGLSGGEALRLALARAMVNPNADIILADEPTAHLDSDTAQEVADKLIALAAGKTLVVATHDEAFASRMDRVVRLEQSL